MWDLLSIGVGCIIGTGIFVLTGKVAVENAGPGVVISFLICGIACIFAALCYAEFASMLPIAGSAYTFAYASLGEVIAWIIGWDLILEYGIAASAVAVGWSGYFVNILEQFFHIKFPTYLALSPEMGGIVNLPAIVIVGIITTLLIVGIKESALINNIIVVIKVAISLFIVGFGMYFVNTANWNPLVPNFIAKGGEAAQNLLSLPFSELSNVELYKVIGSLFHMNFQQGFGGWGGIMLGASIMFFAYIGFDAVSTTAEEAKNPQKDLPIGIIGSLVICTILYVLMSMVFTGIVKCDGTLTMKELGTSEGAPMAYMFNQIHQSGASKLVSIGAIAGITSVLLVTLLGQTRIFFAMSRDGLLPPFVAKVHPRFKTPYIVTIASGIFFAMVAGFMPLRVIAELANIGTLFAFVIVSVGIIFLRKYQPERKASFRVPLVPLFPIISTLFCVGLMMSLPFLTWIRFGCWLGLGMLIYWFYGIKHSRLQKNIEAAKEGAA